jgi:hypothetical protein
MLLDLIEQIVFKSAVTIFVNIAAVFQRPVGYSTVDKEVP